MKSSLLLTTFLFIGSLSMAQEIKVKKGEILLDDKAVAKLEKKDKAYNISDMGNKLLLKAVITSVTPLNNQASKSWLQLTGANGIVKELELSSKAGFTLSSEKYLSENLVFNALSLFTGGIDEAKASAYFQAEDRHISTQEDIYIENIKRMEKTEDSIAKIDAISIDRAGNVSSKGNKIGSLVKKTVAVDKMFGDDLSYAILDMNKFVVAQLVFSTGMKAAKNKEITIKTFDEKSFTINTKYTSDDMATDILAKRVVYKLYANGYRLGNMKAELDRAQADKNKAYGDIVQGIKNKSLNIYDARGYVVDARGNRKEGEVTIEFESIDAKLKPNSGMADITSYGSSVALKVNGKNEFYKAKDGVRFCAGDRCFIGAMGSEDGGLGNDSGSQLSMLGESQFFQVVYENDGNYVVSHVKHPEYFYLKLKNNNKAIYLGDKGAFGTKAADKIKKAFDKYVNCTALDFSKFNTKTKEGLMEVVTAYQTSCNK